MPDEAKVQFDTIEDRTDFVKSRLDRIEDRGDGKTITIRVNVKLPVPEFLELTRIMEIFAMKPLIWDFMKLKK